MLSDGHPPVPISLNAGIGDRHRLVALWFSKAADKNKRIRDLPNMRLTLERMVKKAGVNDVTSFMELGASEVFCKVRQVHGQDLDIKLLGGARAVPRDAADRRGAGSRPPHDPAAPADRAFSRRVPRIRQGGVTQHHTRVDHNSRNTKHQQLRQLVLCRVNKLWNPATPPRSADGIAGVTLPGRSALPLASG